MPTTPSRAAITAPAQLEMQPFTPPSPRAHEVLIETRLSLISPGTERAFFLGLPNTALTYPILPGYSNIGRVVELGSEVTALKVGDRVASPSNHASHVVIDAARCAKLPADLSDERAAFFNLIAIAMQGVHKARIELGESVVILGAGVIGLFAMQLARLAGGLPVISVDQHAGRLLLAQQLGADAALTSDDQLPTVLRERLDAEGADVVIEATGNTSPVLLAFQLARPRGRVILLGSARGEADGVNFYRDVHRKGLTIIGAHEITRPQHESAPGWWTQIAEQHLALRLLAAGRLNVDPLITQRFGWQQFPQAYDLLRAWDSSAIGMLVQW
jgi:L-iditol 2-dehydrogenase